MKNLKWYLARVVQFPKWLLKVDIRVVLVERRYGAFIEHSHDIETDLDFETVEAARFWAECRTRWILAYSKKPVIVTVVETTDGQYTEIDSFVASVGEVTILQRSSDR